MSGNERKRILLIEDNRDDEALTLRGIRRFDQNVPVFVARDGEQAIVLISQFAERPADQPSLILMDLRLPKVSGLEVLGATGKQLNESSIPVIVLTSSSDETDVKAAYELGASAYVRKPLEYQEYCDLLGSVLSFWLQYNVGRPPLVRILASHATIF
jgi:two-component system response regulator